MHFHERIEIRRNEGTVRYPESFKCGFFIASEDLRLRGPGDLFGIRQSGVLDFKVADVFQDAKLLQNASEEADRLLLDDPELEFPEHRKLKEHLRINWMRSCWKQHCDVCGLQQLYSNGAIRLHQ